MSSGPFLVAIVAIICWAVVEVVNGKKKKRKDGDLEQQVATMSQQMSKMQERIEVLEKIVTDEQYDLKKQFRDLENDKVA